MATGLAQEQVTTEAMKREGMVTREICRGPSGLLIQRFDSVPSDFLQVADGDSLPILSPGWKLTGEGEDYCKNGSPEVQVRCAKILGYRSDE